MNALQKIKEQRLVIREGKCKAFSIYDVDKSLKIAFLLTNKNKQHINIAKKLIAKD